jgi:hypothetical protein
MYMPKGFLPAAPDLEVPESFDIPSSEAECPHPMDVEKVRGYMPGHEVPRVRAQAGVFTVHSDPTEPLHATNLPDEAQLYKVIVPNPARDQIRFALANYGIFRQTLFPDLTNLAESIRWTRIDALENPAPYPPEGSETTTPEQQKTSQRRSWWRAFFGLE